MPGRRHVRLGQRPIQRILAGRSWDKLGGGFFGGRRLFVQLGADEFVDRARAGLGLVAKRDRNLAADHASVGLPGAEAAHIRYGGARQSRGLRCVDLRIRRRRFGAAG